MNILVTGGAGFIGSHIVDLLIENGHNVIVVDNMFTGDPSNLNKNCIFYNIDITRQEDLKQIFMTHHFDVVYHHAAQIHVQKSTKEPILDAQINIVGTINLLECIRQYGVRKIIYASSAAVYGTPKYLPIDEFHPTSPESCYGVSKLTPEYYIRLYSQMYDFEYTILRYANVYGPRQSAIGEGGVISIFLDKLKNDERPVIYGDGHQTRDFIYVRDIASANFAALNSGNHATINISCETRTSVLTLLDQLGTVSDYRFDPIFAPPREGDIVHSLLSNQLAKDLLLWKPQYDLRSGLQETVDFVLNRQTLKTPLKL